MCMWCGKSVLLKQGAAHFRHKRSEAERFLWVTRPALPKRVLPCKKGATPTAVMAWWLWITSPRRIPTKLILKNNFCTMQKKPPSPQGDGGILCTNVHLV